MGYLHVQLVNCGTNIAVVTGSEAIVQDSFDLRPARSDTLRQRCKHESRNHADEGFHPAAARWNQLRNMRCNCNCKHLRKCSNTRYVELSDSALPIVSSRAVPTDILDFAARVVVT